MSIAKAQAEMRELREKIEAHQSFIANAEARIADLGIYVRIASELGEGHANAAREGTPKAAVNRESGRSREANKAGRARAMSVEAVIKAGHAMLTRDLVELLKPYGLTFGYGNPQLATAELSGILKRESRLRNAGRSVGWILADWNGAHGADEAHRRQAAADSSPRAGRESLDVPEDAAPANEENTSSPDRESASPSSDTETTTQQAAE